MKRLASIFTLALCLCGSANVWAQAKPKITSMALLNGNNGQPLNCTSGGNIAVQLLFNKAMKNSVKPIIKYGLKGGNYNLTVPSGGNWQDTTLFQVIFNINANVPAGPDGEYVFLIFGARDSLNNVAMDSTYSDSLKTSLSIYRSSYVVANADTLNYGTVSFGKAKTDSVRLTIAGCSTVTITSATLLQTSNFTLLNTLTGSAQPGDTLVARIRYQPASRQSHQSRLRVIYSANGKTDTTEVVLRGRGKGARLAFIPGNRVLNYGVLSVNNALSKYVLVYNPPAPELASNDTLRITSIVSSQPDIFQLNPITLPLKIAPADTDTVRVTFTPKAALAYNANLTFTSNDSNITGNNNIVQLTGTGNINQPPDSIRTFTANWSGGSAGFTSLDTLLICLTNNPSGVAFSRVKFTQSNNDPPLNPNDFTNSSVPFVRNGLLCFRVPLKGVITAGRWNCYIWLDGTNGASGFARATLASVTYDQTAPSISALNVTSPWPGGFPYITNAASLDICWSSDDVSGIGEVRWKFSLTPTPPTSNTDTQNGGTFKGNGITCATIPLSQLGNNRWYCYVWLVDRSGNSGFANAVPTVLRIDRIVPTAPGAPSARTIPVLTWFGANQLLGFTLTLPNGAQDAARVRWKFKTPPTANATPDGEAALLRSGTNGNFSVLFNSSALCGDDTLYYWVADSAGNASPLNNSLARYRFDMCPPTITRVKNLSNNIAPIGQAFNDRLLVLDPESGVDTVWVNYRLGGANTEAPPLPALRVGTTDTFQFTIPIAGVTRRGIEFRATARDQVVPAYNGPNVAYGPTNGAECYNYDGGIRFSPDDNAYWYPLRTRTLGEGDYRIDANGNPVPLVASDTTTGYQLFSIPYTLDNNNALATLQDDLGAYDAKQWRLFDYVTQNPVATRWAEGTNARAFTPGRSFFIITRKPNIVLDSGIGTTRRTVCADTLTVYEGWNLIATPFNFPVHKRSLRLINATRDTVSLWSFENQWTFTDVMDAWRGYAIYVVRNVNAPQGAPIQLIVQPVAVPGRIGKVAEPFALHAQEWAVKIAAQANEARDHFNWAGVRSNAQAGFDELELAEPPVIGGYVSVSFTRPEWQQPAQNFATDFRPNTDSEQAWEFEVSTNQTHTNVRVAFDLLGEFPAAANVYVIDEALGIAQNLRTNREYTFRTGAAPVQKKLKLIVGSEQFAAKQAGEIALVPEKFEVLQNYPNPFNPETSIRYNLPEATSVSVVIYDQLGRRVRTLVENAVQQAGYQSVLWDGRDAAGQQVATGIYLYKITAGKQAVVRKMLLAK